MNEQLRFSWAHIVAFIALIAVGYFSFMGFTYITDGNLVYAAIGASISTLLYILVFIGAQVMKSSGSRITRKIIWERILIFGSPLVFVAVMVSISHFWTIRNQNDVISATFTAALNDSRQLFSDYENYSDLRIKNYKLQLDTIVAMKNSYQKEYLQSGFKEGLEQIQKENMVQALRLLLINDNYQKLKTEALVWVDKANEGTSTWNIFLLGNKREIKTAVLNWEKQLKDISSHHLSNEGVLIPVEEFKSNGAQLAANGIDSLTESFTTFRYPTVMAVLFGVVIYLMLILPYFIQQRHGRQIALNYTLLKNGKESGLFMDGVSKDSYSSVSAVTDTTSPYTLKIDEELEETKDSMSISQENNSYKAKKKSFKRITLD